MEKKITINVQFEFYPNENEQLDKSLSLEQVAQDLMAEIDDHYREMKTSDGLWLYFSPAIIQGGN